MTVSAPLRFLGSFAIALCVVLAMLWLALELSGFAERAERRELDALTVDVLSEAERYDLRELLGEGRFAPLPTLRAPAQIDTLDLTRELRGVVRLDVSVDAEGHVAGVRVIDASPAGIYETQAIAEVQSRRYDPAIVDGRAVPTRHLEIVDFTVEPAMTAEPEAD